MEQSKPEHANEAIRRTRPDRATARPGDGPRRTQGQRRARTRQALLKAARELFAQKGFAQTGREEIAARAGVTRGALYHHFESKMALAEAVLDQLDIELVDRVMAEAGDAPSATEMLGRSCGAYIRACADPSVSRLLVDAPSVLGIEAWRARNSAACAPLLARALTMAQTEGAGVPGDPTITAHLLMGMLNEAALVVASSPRRARVLKQVDETVQALVAKLVA